MALGHWLKDYLGPKASGEGGGGAVEVSKIKIATIPVSTTASGVNGNNFVNGTGALDGDKTLDALIGNHQLVGFTYKTNSPEVNPLMLNIFGVGAGGTPVGDPLAVSESLSNIKYLALMGLCGGNDFTSVDIYAICI